MFYTKNNILKTTYKFILILFLLILVTVFGLSFLVLLMSYRQIYNLGELIPLFVILLILIFMLIICKTFSNRNRIRKKKTDESKEKGAKVFNSFWHYMGYFIVLMFLYTIMNYFIYTANYEGNPTYKNNQYLLINHGVIVREINENEYYKYKDYQDRAFSGFISTLSLVGVFLLKEKLTKSK